MRTLLMSAVPDHVNFLFSCVEPLSTPSVVQPVSV